MAELGAWAPPISPARRARSEQRHSGGPRQPGQGLESPIRFPCQPLPNPGNIIQNWVKVDFLWVMTHGSVTQLARLSGLARCPTIYSPHQEYEYYSPKVFPGKSKIPGNYSRFIYLLSIRHIIRGLALSILLLLVTKINNDNKDHSVRLFLQYRYSPPVTTACLVTVPSYGGAEGRDLHPALDKAF